MNKKEKVALVPKLRFPEFDLTSEWNRNTLEEITGRITEKVGDRQLTTLSISAGVGFVSQEEKFSRDISGKQYSNYIVLKKGEFSYNKGNSKKFPQGCIYELEEYEEAAVPNAFISFRFKNNYVPDFYKGYFNNNFHGKQLAKFITSGARSDGLLNISPADFFSIILPTPKDKKEQQKIADCLSFLDDLIKAEAKKLEAIKAHKKGLMQKLFPAKGKTVPEWRFPEFRDCGSWEEKKLEEAVETITDYVAAGSFADLKSKVNYKASPDFAQLVRTVDIKNNFKNKDFVYVNREAFKFLWRVDLNLDAIIMPNIGANIGEVYYLKSRLLPHENNVLGPNALLLRCNKNNNTFISNLLLSDMFQRLLKLIVAASGQPKFNKTELKQITICIPTLPEQQKIADCLTALDDLITAQSQKIEVLKQHKKALIQGLFPSAQEVF